MTNRGAEEIARGLAHKRLRCWDLFPEAKARGDHTAECNIWTDAITAALKEAIAGAKPEWKTIDSAPKDGRNVLLWMVNENHKYSANPREWEGPVVAYWTTHNKGGWVWHGMPGQPTHWAPSPDPPNLPPEHQDEGK